MAANQTDWSMLEQRPVIKYLADEKCKSCEIYRRMCDAYGEEYFRNENVYKWVKYGFATTNMIWKNSPCTIYLRMIIDYIGKLFYLY